jgi:UDP-glucose 4-epimerase
MGRLLVTGGAGFIGSHLVDRLVETHAGEVVAIDNLRRPCAVMCPRLQHMDIRYTDGLREAMAGAEIVFHLAAESSVLGAARNEAYTHQTNIIGTANVLAAAKSAGVRRFVFASSREVYGEAATLPVPESAPLNAVNTYGISKVRAEALCREASGQGMETVILRLANVYGARDHGRVIPLFLNAALSGDALKLFDGTKTLDFIWIDRVVDALLASGFGPWISNPVNIGSGRAVTLRELAERIIWLCGSSSPIHELRSRAGEVSHFVADVSRYRSLWARDLPEDSLDRLPNLLGHATAAR